MDGDRPEGGERLGPAPESPVQGAGPANRWSMTDCDRGPDPHGARPTSCEVVTSLAHANPEQAVTYQGEATWEWRDGTHRVSFETRCTTAPGGHAACGDPVSTWHD